jgi:molybdopterin molybdotransferase
MLTVPEAVAEITSGIQPRDVERVPLLDVLGRVLATPAIAPYTLPQWDNSAMDGYAVRSDDVASATTDQVILAGG